MKKVQHLARSVWILSLVEQNSYGCVHLTARQQTAVAIQMPCSSPLKATVGVELTGKRQLLVSAAMACPAGRVTRQHRVLVYWAVRAPVISLENLILQFTNSLHIQRGEDICIAVICHTERTVSAARHEQRIIPAQVSRKLIPAAVHSLVLGVAWVVLSREISTMSYRSTRLSSNTSHP